MLKAAKYFINRKKNQEFQIQISHLPESSGWLLNTMGCAPFGPDVRRPLPVRCVDRFANSARGCWPFAECFMLSLQKLG